ncbi:MAG TPA: type II toxin-antitoxin system YafQ family toxin [Prolixibacteraceae bacterium]|nr:type II toxin-antitoxin system YafQ family toxin [Prolixibacteraceae bacterium]HPS12831.1 type II toxin-antitoxin system YafQ family toxin [Prolixibacteraceae bacterium]
MFTCNFTNKFKKDYKRAIKRGWDLSLFENAYDLLEAKGELPTNYKPHLLTGNWIGYIDAHIQPDWVLIYKIDKSAMSIDFVRMGTHADLF